MNNIDLTPFFVLGALLALSVIAMIFWRKAVAHTEDDTLHVLDAGNSVVAHQAEVAHKLETIDKWGKTLTVVTVVYCLIVGAIFVYQQWMRASNLGL